MTAHPADLAGWLEYVERQHPKTIALGLERVAQVRDRLGFPKLATTFIVAGTNGKGSTCAMLESILLAAGYRTGLYTSPHLVRYNERVRVAGEPVDDATLVEGFARVEAARGAVLLTYFEFGTLAAMTTFADSSLDALILEVGMGGRLDAVNAFDPHAAILTSVDLDHMEYLGDTREQIGWEKAHVFRAGRPAIVGDPAPPESVLRHAREIGADLQVQGRDFGYEGDSQQWLYWGRAGRRSGLPYPALRGANQLLNASSAIAALESLRDRLPVGAQDIRNGLARVELPGRFQVLPGRPTVILDVAHNPHAAAVLADNLDNMGFYPVTHAVFGMLRDKDIGGVIDKLGDRIDHWHLAPTPGPRGCDTASIAALLRERGRDSRASISEYPDLSAAYDGARCRAGADDRILAFGSFLTVAEVMRAIRARPAATVA